MRFRVAVILTVFVVFVGACSGDDGDEASEPATEEATDDGASDEESEDEEAPVEDGGVVEIGAERYEFTANLCLANDLTDGTIEFEIVGPTTEGDLFVSAFVHVDDAGDRGQRVDVRQGGGDGDLVWGLDEGQAVSLTGDGTEAEGSGTFVAADGTTAEGAFTFTCSA